MGENKVTLEQKSTNHWLDFAEKIADEKRNKKVEGDAELNRFWEEFTAFYKGEVKTEIRNYIKEHGRFPSSSQRIRELPRLYREGFTFAMPSGRDVELTNLIKHSVAEQLLEEDGFTLTMDFESTIRGYDDVFITATYTLHKVAGKTVAEINSELSKREEIGYGF